MACCTSRTWGQAGSRTSRTSSAAATSSTSRWPRSTRLAAGLASSSWPSTRTVRSSSPSSSSSSRSRLRRGNARSVLGTTTAEADETADAVTAARAAKASQRDPSDDQEPAGGDPRRHGLLERHRPEADGQRRDGVGGRDRPRGPEGPQADVPRHVAQERREDAEVEDQREVACRERRRAGDVGAREDREQAGGSDQAGRRGQREQVVSREERLQEHVVEREGKRRADDDQGPLEPVERELLARTEADDNDDSRECDSETERDAHAETLDAEGDRKRHGERGGEGNDQRGDPGGRGLLAEVQREVVAGDDDDAGDEHTGRVAPVQSRKAASAPEEKHEPGRGNEVAGESDLLGANSVVEKRLDDGERRGPDDDDGRERELRKSLHASL